MTHRLQDLKKRNSLLQQQLAHLRHKSQWFTVAQIGMFLAAVGMVACAITYQPKALYALLAAVLFVGYLLLRRTDGRNSRNIERQQRLIAAYMREISYFRGDYSCFDEGKDYIDASHPFSFDLDLFGKDSLFQRVCRTVTVGGRNLLAQWLTKETADGNHKDFIASIGQRRKAVEELARHDDFLMNVKASGQRSDEAMERLLRTDWLADALTAAHALPLPKRCSPRWLQALRGVLLTGFYLSVVAALTGFVSVILPIAWGTLHLLFASIFPGNSVRRIMTTLQNIHTLSEGLDRIIRLTLAEEFHEEVNKTLQASLRQQAASLAEMEQILQDIDNRNNEAGILLFNVFALIDLNIVRRFKLWQQSSADFEALIRSVSVLDALVSLASYRQNEPATTWPTFVDTPSMVFEGEALRHPFLGLQAVANDAMLQDRNFYIITGANMAGKSTFLRTVGISWVMAMAGLPVYADRLTLSPCRLFTGMRTSDDLTHGISYFNAELLRLKQLIDVLDDTPTLVILDEILRGTNSKDKLHGSQIFLEYLSRHNVTAIIATHDLELSQMAEDHGERFHNYCFEISIGEHITYDYRITPGIAKNQNATYLLKKMITAETTTMEKKTKE
jgi:DNA mismatch repair ATPase MutS